MTTSFTPAHKQTNPEHKPGQVVNDVTLADYIRRKQRDAAFNTVNTEQKLTFDEWYLTIKPKDGGMPYDDWFVCMKAAWQAAQENK